MQRLHCEPFWIIAAKRMVQLVLLTALVCCSSVTGWAVTHDDSESMIPEFVIRFKAKPSTTGSLTVECSTYTIYDTDADPDEWRPYKRSVSFTTTASGANWSQARSIIMHKGIPLDMHSDLKVTGNNVAEYQIMMKTPDAKYVPYVQRIPQRLISKVVPPATTLNDTHQLMFLHGGRSGGVAGKVEKASAGNDNLRISLGRGITGQSLGHLSIRKRYEPWIADASYETFVLEQDGNHHQIVSPQMVFDIVYNPANGTFTVGGYDRETQPGVFVPVANQTGYINFSGLTPITTYTFSHVYDQPNKIEDYTFSRTEGIVTMTTRARRQALQQNPTGFYLMRPCFPTYCWIMPPLGWAPSTCFAPPCPPPIYLEVAPGLISVTDDIRDWKLQGSTQLDRLLHQTETHEWSAVAGKFIKVNRTRSVKWDGTGQPLAAEYDEESPDGDTAIEMPKNALFWERLNIKFDGASSGAFAGNVTYNHISDYTPLDVNSGSHLMLGSRVLPGGNWEKYTYHDTFLSYGMLKQVIVPFKNSPTGPGVTPLNGAMITDYTYAADWDGSVTLPASVITRLKGVPDQEISKTLYDYSESFDGNGDPVIAHMADLDEPQAPPGQGSGVEYQAKLWVTRKTEYANPADASGKVSVIKKFRADDWPWLRGLPYSEEFPDNRKEVYVHQAGVINTTTHEFNVVGFPSIEAKNSGKAFRAIKIKGYADGVPGPCGSIEAFYDGAPHTWQIDPIWVCAGLTTAEVSVTDRYGRLYSVETWVLEDDGSFATTTKVVHKYDVAGNLVEKKRLVLNGSTEQYETIYQAQFTTRNGDSVDYNVVSFDNALTGGAQFAGRKQYERGEDGVIKKFYYDDYGRAAKVVQLAGPGFSNFPNPPASQTVFEYDADNRVTASVVGPVQAGLTSDPNALRSENQYNTMGVIKKTTAPGQRVTDYLYNNADRKATIIARGLGDAQFDRTTVKEAYRDGQQKSVSGNAVVPSFYDYSVVAGEIKEDTYHGSSSATTLFRTTTYKDGLGRVKRTERSNPAAIGNLVGENFYNSRGQHERSTVSGLAAELHLYGFTAQRNFSGLDLNGSGALEPASTDRMSDQITYFVFQDGAWWERTENYAYPKNNLGDRFLTSTTLKRSSHFPKQTVTVNGAGLVMILDSEIVHTDPSGTTTRQLTYAGSSQGGVSLRRTISSLHTTPSDEILVNGKVVGSIDSGGVRVDRSYDGFGRLASVTDRKGATTFEYRPGTAEKFRIKTPDRIWTEYEYDPAGRVKLEKRYLTKADAPSGASRVTRFAYNLRDQVEKTWGDLPIPVRNIYFEAADGLPELVGKLKEQITYNGGSGWNGVDWPTGAEGTANKTSYAYYRENGLILTETRHKVDPPAATQTTTYTYNIRGRLVTRATPRGITTSYQYRPGSGELDLVTYSSGGSVDYEYDRLGAIQTVTDAAGTRTFKYRDIDGQLEYEDLPTATYGAGVRLTAAYDFAERPNGHQFTAPGVAMGDTYQFYAADGRLKDILSPSLSASPFTYGYRPNSPLVASVSCAGLPAMRVNDPFSVVIDYEPDVDRLRSMTTLAGREVARFDFQYDNQSRLWKSARSGELFKYFGSLTETFGYDDRDQLVSSGSTASAGGNNITIAGRSLAYDYDNTGNREYADRGTDRTTYGPNTLGQYNSRNGPAVVPMSGLAIPDATLSVRNTAFGSPVSPTMTVLPVSAAPAAYYQANVTFSGAADWVTLEATAHRQSQLVHSQQRNMLIPAAAETFQYDAAGNLTDDSLWHYVYDPEDRLIEVVTEATLPAHVPRKKLVFTYDYLGRRVKKQVYNGNPAGTIWTIHETRCFVYEGWNLIVELKQVGAAAPVPMTYYAWGLDVSGSLQGAGGVGGLLGFVTALDTANPKAYCTVNDGSGNIVGLLDGMTGDVVAEYEYTPFGELIRSHGLLAAQNTFRFSSKYFDIETGLVNFGFRYYSSSLARFINRDPKGEQGWANLVSDLSGGHSSSWSYIGELLANVHENRYGGEESTLAHSTESGSGKKNSSQNNAPLMDRKGLTSSVTSPGGGTGGGGGAPRWSHPYGYLGNDPLNDVEYLGLSDLDSWWYRNITGPGGLLGIGGPVFNFEMAYYDAAPSIPVINMVAAADDWNYYREQFGFSLANRLKGDAFREATASTLLDVGLLFTPVKMGMGGRMAGFLEKPAWLAAERRLYGAAIDPTLMAGKSILRESPFPLPPESWLKTHVKFTRDVRFAGTDPFTGQIHINPDYWARLAQTPGLQATVFWHEMGHATRIIGRSRVENQINDFLYQKTSFGKFLEEAMAHRNAVPSWRHSLGYAWDYDTKNPNLFRLKALGGGAGLLGTGVGIGAGVGYTGGEMYQKWFAD